MEKVTMTAYGMNIIVDADQVKLHEKKSAALAAVQKYHSVYPSLPRAAKVIFDELLTKEFKIIKTCNHKIRQNVQFV